MDRKRRALAELERVRAFNDTVVAAAIATRAGTRRVLETATLAAALTNAYDAPPVPEEMVHDRDAPVPFFEPALGEEDVHPRAHTHTHTRPPARVQSSSVNPIECSQNVNERRWLRRR